MREKVRVGVVGVGSLGQHHARIYSELDEVEFVGLFDSDSARAAEIAAASHSRAFDRLEDLAAEVDAASVAVPTHLHREVAGELLAQGLHLLVEKPIASTTREAEELVAMAQERNLILQVGHIERFNPVLDTLEQQTGRPRFIEASFWLRAWSAGYLLFIPTNSQDRFSILGIRSAIKFSSNSEAMLG